MYLMTTLGSITATILITFASLEAFLFPSHSLPLVSTIAFMLCVACATFVFTSGSRSRPGLRELAARVTSKSDLDRIAHSLYRAPITYLLRSQALARALAGAIDPKTDRDKESTVEAPMDESNESEAQVVSVEELDDSIPEIAYFVEAIQWKPDIFARNNRLRALAWISLERDLDEGDKLSTLGRQPSLTIELSLALHESRFQVFSNVWFRRMLLDAFRAGLDQDTSALISEVSDLDIRQALNELSPFDERGLGALSDLKNIERIDECYLFFSAADVLQESRSF